MLFDDEPDKPGDPGVVQEALQRWKSCKTGNPFRTAMREDIKFANGDARNTWQWPSKVYQMQTGGDQRRRLSYHQQHPRSQRPDHQSMSKNRIIGVKITPTGGKARPTNRPR